MPRHSHSLYTATRRVPQASRINVTLYTAADGFLICLLGRLSWAQAEKILPRHAELVELDDGRLAAVCHVAAARVRPLIERLTSSAYRVDFSSQPPAVWAASVAATVL